MQRYVCVWICLDNISEKAIMRIVLDCSGISRHMKRINRFILMMLILLIIYIDSGTRKLFIVHLKKSVEMNVIENICQVLMIY